MISHKYKFIFIHIPKCAGTSIEKCLADKKTIFDWNHKAAATEDNPLPFGDLRETALAKTIKNFPDYYLFTFCRNPWERAVSTYLHSQRGEGRGIFNRHAPLGSFSDFLEEVSRYLIDGESGDLSAFEKYHLLPQFKFIPEGGKDFFSIFMRAELTVDYIGRVESFDSDFGQILNNLKLAPRTVKKHNSSRYLSPWESHYTPRLFDKVSKIYRSDILYFKYEAFKL